DTSGTPAVSSGDAGGGGSSTDVTILDADGTFVSSTVFQITFTVDGDYNDLDRITIANLGFVTTGSTAFGAAQDITRVGGSADLFGIAEADNPVFGGVTSVSKPTAPNLNTNEFRIEVGGAFPTFGATSSVPNSPTNFTWYYLDQSTVAFTDNGVNNSTPSVTDLNGTGGAQFLNTEAGVFTVYVTETDANGCESDFSAPVHIGVLNFANSRGTNSYFDDDLTGTTITASKPASGYSASFAGNGLTNIDVASSPATVDFIPSIAGTTGSPHSVSYTLTRDADGVDVSYAEAFTVSASGAASFTSAPQSQYCFGDVDSDIDVISSANPFFRLAILDKGNSNIETGFGTALNPPAGWSDPTDPGPGTIIADLTLAGWEIDAGQLAAGEYRLVRFVVPSGTADGETDKVQDGFFDFTVFDLPTVDIDTIVNDYYCEDDDDINPLQVVVEGVTVDVTNGYTIVWDYDNDGDFTDIGSGAYSVAIDDTGDEILRPTDPLRTAGVPGGVVTSLIYPQGDYQIIYTSTPQGAANCTDADTAIFEILSKPSQAVLDLTSVSSNEAESGTGNYVIEYTGESGLVIQNLTAIVDAGNADQAFRWYNDIAGTSLISTNTSGTKTETLDAFTELFGGISTTSRTTQDVFLAELDHVDINSSGFEGCRSDIGTINIEVYAIPNAPEVNAGLITANATNENNLGNFSVPSSATGVASSGYVYEYCVASGASATLADVVETLGLSAEQSGESYYVLFDSDTVTELAAFTDQTITEAELTTILSFTPNASAGAIDFFVSRVDFDPEPDEVGASDTDLGSSTNSAAEPYAGCESDLRNFRIQVFDIPDAPNPSDFDNGDANNNGGVVEYYLCRNNDLGTIQAPNQADASSSYVWYESDGTTPIGASAFNDRSITATELGFDNTVTIQTTYTYFVSQVTNTNESSGFEGCESAQTQIDIIVYPDPVPPEFVNPDTTNILVNAADMEFIEAAYCQGSNDLEVASFAMTASANSEIRVYEADVDSAITRINPIAFIDGTSGSASVTAEDLKITAADPGTYYFLVSQVNDITPNGSTFEGCETLETDMAFMTVYVYEVPSEPNTTSFDEDFCEDVFDGAGGITVEGEGNPGEIFRWYADTNNDNVPDSPSSPVFTGSFATSADLGLAGNLGTGSYQFLVSQTQSIGDGVATFEGCESEYLTITIFEVPQYLLRLIPIRFVMMVRSPQ
ncbi:MAG: hypothetical protein KI790_09325, partial [Cyclobacteriaceae bacterium]|nr:hypothetical protein [Cyclobacteriaceae bacterium HetDA_MAG_MS6]